MWYRDFLQQVIYKVINPLIKGMIKVGITPNVVTTVGFIGNIIAAAFFIVASQQMDMICQTTILGWGGFIIIASGLFDMMDSTLDRYSELVSLFGIVLVFLEDEGWFWMGVVTFAAMVGSVMVSYVRARAEGLGIECKVGFMQRPERVVVTALTAILTGVSGSLWWLAGGMILIAVLANITAFWRVAYCYGKLNARDKAIKSSDKE